MLRLPVLSLLGQGLARCRYLICQDLDLVFCCMSSRRQHELPCKLATPGRLLKAGHREGRQETGSASCLNLGYLKFRGYCLMLINKICIATNVKELHHHSHRVARGFPFELKGCCSQCLVSSCLSNQNTSGSAPFPVHPGCLTSGLWTSNS